MQTPRSPRSNQQRSDTTRHALLSAAHPLFVAHGYAATSTPSIVAAAGLTRGALYHHFHDKRALFQALVEQEAHAVAAHIEASTATATTAIEALLVGADAYVDAMAVGGRTRLLLIEGPAVLGLATMHAIDAGAAARTLRDGLHAALPNQLTPLELERLSSLISAAFDRAALELEAGHDRTAVVAAIHELLTRLTA